MTAHVCPDTAYPAAAMPDECTCGGDMPNPDEYNGWTNRETWAANLWLTNTPELYEATLGAVRRARAEGIDLRDNYGLPTDESTGASLFADYMSGGGLEDIADLLRHDPRNGTPEGMLRDIGSAWRIDWRELFTGLLEHLDEMAATAAEDES
jgi:hypothetical protein